MKFQIPNSKSQTDSKFKIQNSKIKKLLPGIKRNILLKNYTTFRIGGPARYFFVAKTEQDLIKAIKVAKKLNLPFFIFGGGSNLLVADEGFKGLVIKIQNSKLKIQNDNSKFKIICDAGIPLSKLVNISVEKNLTGLEWAIGIPGTVGGAIFGNAGAFGNSMADIVKWLKVLEISSHKIQNSKLKIQNDNSKFKIRKYKNKNCKFGYRNSIFKKNKNLIILSATFQLKKGDKKEIKEKIKEYLDYRKRTQPLEFPSAGSIFKNPPNFSAGELIEKCGLKGKRIGNAKISERHANFIVNLGKAKAKDVRKLIALVKKRVKKKFEIELEEEIQYLF